jgi:hypothetical protein
MVWKFPGVQVSRRPFFLQMLEKQMSKERKVCFRRSVQVISVYATYKY